MAEAPAVPLDDAAFGPPIGTPDGFIELVDRPDPSGQSLDRLLYVASADGRAWQRLDTSDIGGAVVDLAAGPAGWVLVATASGPLAAATSLWFSSDGRTWGRVPDAGAPGVAGSTPGKLVAGPRGFVLTGEVETASGQSAAVWLSHDGRRWQAEDALAGVDATFFVLDNAFLGFGNDDADPTVYVSVDGSAWRAIPIDPAAPFATAVFRVAQPGAVVELVEPGQSGGPEVWRAMAIVGGDQPDVDWAPAPGPEIFGGAGFVAATASGQDLVILGYDAATVAPLAWTSSDGLTWRRTAVPETAFGGGIPFAIGGGAHGFAAFGWQVDAAGRAIRQPWRSDDGLAWTAVETDVFGALPAAPPGPCPASSPTRVADYLAMDPFAWPACFGSRTVHVRGYVTECGGCGGVSGYVGSPPWLIDGLGFFRFWVRATPPTADYGGSLGVQVDPAHPIKVPPAGTQVELAGHFSDPASPGCRLDPFPPLIVEVRPAALAVAICERTFVATGVTILAN